MKKSLYKRMEGSTSAWDLTSRDRRYIINNENQRKLRKELRRKARKAINRTVFSWE